MRAVLKLLVMVVWLFLLVIPGAFATVFGLEALRKFMVIWVFKGLNAIIGLKIELKGRLSSHRPIMLVTNHCSYLDIFTLASQVPVSFTPKSDIRSWPVIGFCCVLAGCVFVERKASKMIQTRARIEEGLAKGRVICLFPEGTTNDGSEIKPFKSGFFSIAEGQDALMVQPATIVYSHVNGKVLDDEGRKDVAWFDDTLLVPHLFALLNKRSIHATIEFHEPLKMVDYESRKALCAESERVISSSYKEAIR
ncbi:MAG: 1-acyl-sn-glycerol-3-phosphate acyltransferase [Rickettsiales bacterium]|nr:1-acyl-sn-glycerol-3-phosphate acyltransferase [Rickettsiales bacterium]